MIADNMKYSRTPGFGLIEILISVAIIGILVTMFSSRVGLRGGAMSDATIRARFTVAKTEAAAYHSMQEPPSYKGICGNISNYGNPTDFSNTLQEIAGTAGGTISCAANDEEYAAAISFLKEDGGSDVFCVDSHGFSGRLPGGDMESVRLGRCLR